ncbi:MAG: FeoB-associated Cys-rich membrane protein [Desulfohalobiaceae bacterium]
MWDAVIVLVAVGVALFFVIKRLRRSVKSAASGESACTSCEGCPVSSSVHCQERLQRLEGPRTDSGHPGSQD